MNNRQIMTAAKESGQTTSASNAREAQALPNSPAAPDHILATKFVIPSSPVQMVPRPRLLQQEESPRIRLVCAPAGYGKTTLIASWARANQSPIAWLSLDAGDNDPVRFLMHFIHAIRPHFADFGNIAMDMMAANPPPPIPGLMRTLVNQLCGLPERLCIILDDLHAVTETAVHEAIAFLVDHQPPQVQLIFASRNDPPFSLARIRGQRQLLEYRTEDLRFTLEEARSFCNDVMQFSLPQEQVEALAARTEGWIVGLQLAAVSLRNTPDKATFIHNFAGDNRHITDFLLDEVLRSRSIQIQNFLLQTSILERFSAPLCDAVMETTDSRERIDEMERANMFIVGLDHQRIWYRYHHLFASLLQNRLRNVSPGLIQTLHRRASRWFSENNLITEAIDQAIKAADHEFALDLMEQHRTHLFSHGQTNTALAWARMLPEDALAKRPTLSMTCAWGNFYMDNSVEMDRHIRAVERCLAAFPDTSADSKVRAMRAQVALLRGCHSGYNGDLEGALSHHLEAHASFTPGRLMHRVAGTCLGVAYFRLGDLDKAQSLFEENSAISEVKYDVLAPVAATLGLGRVHLARGRLLTAKGVFERALQECKEAGWQDFPACGMLHMGLGEVAYEMNDLALAEQHLTHGVDLTATGMQYFNAWGRVLLVRTRLAAGVADAALEPQREASLMKYLGRFIFDIPPLSAVLGRLWLSQGRMDAVSLWSEAVQLPVGERLAIGCEADYIVLARFFIASEQRTKALELLDRLWIEAEQGKHVAAMIEISILKALALQGNGAGDEALAALQQAVNLAENTHLLRLFINEGSALSALLRKLARGADNKSHVHSLLAHFGAEASQEAPQGVPPLARLFSKKELQVASHIVKGASNKDIADALFISLNTLNSHMKNIYAKLGVNTRLQAIERLRQLGLSG
jgi:LuxR family transcriptional regulator, maltose regulon positive regulatory protein